MGLTGEILAATRRYRRRGLKRQTLRAADMLFAGWAMLVILIRFALNCALAVRELRGGSRAVGLALAEFCSLHALGVAVLLSFLVSSLSLGTATLDRRRLLLSPVPFSALFLAEIAGLFSGPVSALVIAFIVPMAAALLPLPQPIVALLAFLACFASAIAIGGALSMAVSLGPRARRLAGLFRGAFAAVLVALVLANFDFQWKAGPVSLFVFTKRTLLDDGAGRGLLAILRPWSPSAWVAASGVSPLAGLLASLALAGASVALFGLLLSLAMRAAGRGPVLVRGSSHRGTRRPSSGGLFAALFSHELGLLASRGATRFGALAAAGFTAWTLVAREASVNIPLLGAILALAALFPYASNLFGADGWAMRRYVMLSPDWGALFAARNAASLAASAVLLAPLIVAAAVRISLSAAVAFALSAALVALLHVLWGNLSSMLLPSIAGRAGRAGTRPPGFANQIALFAAWGLPLALDRSLARFGTRLFDAAAGAGLVACCLLYGIMLRRLQTHFGEEVEGVLGRM
ncbi:MAG: hypothetical protein IMZ55_14560 [Acidobacteria bacterium]|nr:hypothetical protein [Acidobacteriota bacterium]